MFLQTLPVAALSPVLHALPASQTATSFFLPKLAEQGFGVPVREIDGNYIPALRQRLDALLNHTIVAHSLAPQHVNNLKGFMTEENPRVRDIIPMGGSLLTDFEPDKATAEALISLLLVKEAHDLESLGLDFRYERRVPVEQKDVPYLQLLYGLEHFGAINGIAYVYDKFVGGSTQYHDIRTIKVDPDFLLDVPRRFGKTALEILQILERGRQIDGDAGPLHDFFADAFASGRADTVRGFSKTARLFVTTYPHGRRHPVMTTTIVDAT